MEARETVIRTILRLLRGEERYKSKMLNKIEFPSQKSSQSNEKDEND